MLLFMIETHLDYLKQLLRKLRLKKFFKMLIDIVTIFINFRNSRPAHKSAIRAYHPVAQAVIITVEEVGKIRMVLLVALQIWQGTSCSKNQVVWARCHFGGDTYSIGCNT